jgi:hypothetical protein
MKCRELLLLLGGTMTAPPDLRAQQKAMPEIGADGPSDRPSSFRSSDTSYPQRGPASPRTPSADLPTTSCTVIAFAGWNRPQRASR